MFFLFLGELAETAGLGEVLAPFLIQLGEHLEFFLEIEFFLGGGIGIFFFRVGLVAGAFHLDPRFVLGNILEQRILLELFLHK